MGGLSFVDARQHLLAHADELGLRLHAPRVAVRQELARERHVVVHVGDAARARAHHHQPGGQEQRLLDRVRDEEDHLVRLRPGVQQDLLHLLAGECVERTHRLVHQKNGRVVGQRARDADPLLHAARQFVDGAVGELAQAHEVELFLGHAAAGGGIDAAHSKSERDVVAYVEPRHQRVLLEHHAAVGAGACHRLAVEQDLAGRWRQEAGDAVQQRGLAAAGSAQRDHEVAVLHRHVDGGQRLQHAALDGVVDREVADLERGHERIPRLCPTAQP
jgi:hypothetical protein